jgi:hypothetical protein
MSTLPNQVEKCRSPPENAHLEEAHLMDWSAVLTELPKAVPPLVGTLVGGLLAVTGGVAAQYFTHHFTRARETEKLIREKAEQLIHELYAQRHWLDVKHNAAVFHQSDPDTPSPLDRAYAFQGLYFPELRQHLDAIRAAEIQLVRFDRIQLERQLQDPQAWHAQREQNIAEWLQIHRAYIKTSETAVAAAVAAAQKRLDT